MVEMLCVYCFQGIVVTCPFNPVNCKLKLQLRMKVTSCVLVCLETSNISEFRLVVKGLFNSGWVGTVRGCVSRQTGKESGDLQKVRLCIL